jgi:hypothetical protein
MIMAAMTVAVVAAVSTAAVSTAAVSTPATSESTAGPVKPSEASAPAYSDPYGREKPKHSNIDSYTRPNGGINVGLILRPPPSPVDHCRVVTGHIYNFRINGLNVDVLTSDNNLLLGGRLDIASGISLMPQSLN